MQSTVKTPDDLPVLIASNPAANRPGTDGEPLSVRDAYDALPDKSGKGGRK
jgi:hypothetical protein